MSILRSIVDRIEGETAVLLIGDKHCRIVLPLDLLPMNMAEGSVLDISVEINLDAAKDARRRTKAIINRLSAGETDYSSPSRPLSTKGTSYAEAGTSRRWC